MEKIRLCYFDEILHNRPIVNQESNGTGFRLENTTHQVKNRYWSYIAPSWKVCDSGNSLTSTKIISKPLGSNCVSKFIKISFSITGRYLTPNQTQRGTLKFISVDILLNCRSHKRYNEVLYDHCLFLTILTFDSKMIPKDRFSDLKSVSFDSWFKIKISLMCKFHQNSTDGFFPTYCRLIVLSKNK